MAGRIVFVGRRSAPQQTGSLAVERWESRELFVRRAAPPSAIVLFADAIETIEPDSVRVVLGPAAARVLLCLGTCHTPTMRHVSAWAQAGFRQIVEPGRIVQFLAARAARLRRPDIPTEDWLGFRPEPGSDAEQLAQRIAALDEFDARSLAIDLHRSDTWLRVACRRALRMPPRRAIRRYRLALAETARRAGATMDECAEVAKYADAATMFRAFRSARRSSDGVAQGRAAAPIRPAGVSVRPFRPHSATANQGTRPVPDPRDAADGGRRNPEAVMTQRRRHEPGPRRRPVVVAAAVARGVDTDGVRT